MSESMVKLYDLVTWRLTFSDLLFWLSSMTRAIIAWIRRLCFLSLRAQHSSRRTMTEKIVDAIEKYELHSRKVSCWLPGSNPLQFLVRLLTLQTPPTAGFLSGFDRHGIWLVMRHTSEVFDTLPNPPGV